MTDKRKNEKPPVDKGSWKQTLVRDKYEDGSGIPRVVLIPEGETNKAAGIPLSLDLSSLFGHMPQSFQRALYKALHDQGLIEPADFFKAGAADRYQRALRTVIKHDFLSIQALAKEELKNG
jgi:hypothetical protein